eukprot:GHVH01010197.1.p1 GENE.GHVH01010197.1~~GHVH01010197.1.p1  ORF type:complete len:775 (+),score=81.59 GHVH01010197.1:118-2442(+)
MTWYIVKSSAPPFEVFPFHSDILPNQLISAYSTDIDDGYDFSFLDKQTRATNDKYHNSQNPLLSVSLIAGHFYNIRQANISTSLWLAIFKDHNWQRASEYHNVIASCALKDVLSWMEFQKSQDPLTIDIPPKQIGLLEQLVVAVHFEAARQESFSDDSCVSFLGETFCAYFLLHVICISSLRLSKADRISEFCSKLETIDRFMRTKLSNGMPADALYAKCSNIWSGDLFKHIQSVLSPNQLWDLFDLLISLENSNSTKCSEDLLNALLPKDIISMLIADHHQDGTLVHTCLMNGWFIVEDLAVRLRKTYTILYDRSLQSNGHSNSDIDTNEFALTFPYYKQLLGTSYVVDGDAAKFRLLFLWCPSEAIYWSEAAVLMGSVQSTDLVDILVNCQDVLDSCSVENFVNLALMLDDVADIVDLLSMDGLEILLRKADFLGQGRDGVQLFVLLIEKFSRCRSPSTEMMPLLLQIRKVMIDVFESDHWRTLHQYLLKLNPCLQNIDPSLCIIDFFKNVDVSGSEFSTFELACLNIIRCSPLDQESYSCNPLISLKLWLIGISLRIDELVCSVKRQQKSKSMVSKYKQIPFIWCSATYVCLPLAYQFLRSLRKHEIHEEEELTNQLHDCLIKDALFSSICGTLFEKVQQIEGFYTSIRSLSPYIQWNSKDVMRLVDLLNLDQVDPSLSRLASCEHFKLLYQHSDEAAIEDTSLKTIYELGLRPKRSWSIVPHCCTTKSCYLEERLCTSDLSIRDLSHCIIQGMPLRTRLLKQVMVAYKLS